MSWNDPWVHVCFCTILLKILHKRFFIVKYFHSNKDEKLKITDLCFQVEKLGGKKCELNVVQVEGKWIIEHTSIELENRKRINKSSRHLKVSLRHACALSRFGWDWLWWTAVHQAPLSMGFSRQEFWSGSLCSPSGDLLNPQIQPNSLVSTCIDRWVLYHWWQLGSLGWCRMAFGISRMRFGRAWRCCEFSPNRCNKMNVTVKRTTVLFAFLVHV